MPPGMMKSHVKKRKASEESEEQRDGSEEQEQQPQLMVANRQRRSAAMKSHQVWDSLKPGAKLGMEEESAQQQGRGLSPPNNSDVGATRRTRQTPKRAKNAKDGGGGMESPDEPKIEPKQEEAQGGDVPAADQPPKLAPISPAKQPPQPQHVIISPTKRVVVGSSSTSSSTVRVYQTQPALKRDQLELIEREMEKGDQFDESSEHDEPSDEEDEEMMEGGHHGMQNSRGGQTATHRFMLDDPDDEDFLDRSSGRGGGRGSRGGGVGRGRGRGGGRGSRGGGTGTARGTVRGRPRGSRGGGTGILRGGGTMRAPRMPLMFPKSGGGPPMGRGGIYSLQPAGGIVGELSSRPIPGAGSPQIVRVLRPAGVPIQSNYPHQSLRPAVLSQQQQMAETNFAINRELENYRGRVVEGTSVGEFNEIIDNFLAEYQRLVEDRAQLIAGHREYVNHLKLSHQAAQDIKDNKIRYLEQTLEQLQQKLVTGFKQDQLRVVKQGTVGGEGGNPGAEQREGGEGAASGAANQAIQQGIQQVIVGGNVVEGEEDGGMGHEGQGGNDHRQQVWPGVGNGGQRIRILGMGGGGSVGRQFPHENHHPQHRIMVGGPNAVPHYFDDEMDDEEEFEDDGGDSAEMDDELGAQVTI